MTSLRVRMVLATAFASVLAQASPITVPGLADIWLAGQPDGASVTGVFGTDTAPANSPVLVAVSGGQVLSFSAAGTMSHDGGGCFAGPDGVGCFADVTPFGNGPANGIGTYTGPADGLIGVFLNNNTPGGLGGPASLDYTQAANVSTLSYSPALNQIFFIGDGLTGNGAGVMQQFMAPAGATRLFLATGDALGASFNDVGSYSVTVSAPGTAPEPATVSMSIVACLMGLAAVRRRRA